MIAFILRCSVAALTLGLTVYTFYTGHWGWGITLIPVLAIIGLTFFRNENMILALNQMRLGNHEKANMYLKRISAPQFLPRRQHAYVIFLKAVLGTQELGFTKSEQMLRKAIGMGLRTAQDNAVARLHLAGICAQTGRKQEAAQLLTEAKKLDKSNMMKEQIAMLQKQLTMSASKNQMRMVQMNKGRMKSPKMR